MIGRIWVSMRCANSGSVRMAMPMGKKKRRDSASPAANPPSSSGAPTACASHAKNSTSDTTVVGVRPGIWLAFSNRLIISALPFVGGGGGEAKKKQKKKKTMG